VAGFIKISKEYISKVLPPQEEASYIVFRDGNVFYAKDGRAGQIIYTSSDSEALMQYVLNRVSDGDVIYVKDVVYADTLVSKKRVVLTGSGAIYTKTGKLVRLLGNIVVKDLEVDFHTPRTIKQPFIEQFTDPNLTAWAKIIPSGGSAQVYQETKTVSGLTFVERGVAITGATLYRYFPLAYKRMRFTIQLVDLSAPTTAYWFFGFGISNLGAVFTLRINTSGTLEIGYIDTTGNSKTVSTGIDIRTRPVVITVDVDNKNNYASVYVDGNTFTINNWNRYTDLQYAMLNSAPGYTTKLNLVYAEYFEEPPAPVQTIGRPDSYHPVGISDALNVYALGLVYPDGSTHIEIRDLETDALIKVIDLDETINYADEHEYVHTKFAVEGSKRYLYAVLARHGSSYTIYKIDADNWSILWKKSGSAGTYCKLIWGWVTGLAVLYRDGNYGISIDHIDPATGSISRTQTIVSSGGYYVYGTFTPDWSEDGYLCIAWSLYDSAVGLRKNVYALAVDRSGNAYAPDGTQITLPASPTDSRLLIMESDYSLPFSRPAREGAIIFKTGSYSPDTPVAWWFKKPGQVIQLELPPSLPLLGAAPTLIGRIPAVPSLTYVLRSVGATLYAGLAYMIALPINIPYPSGKLMPAENSRILVTSGNYLYIYRTKYKAQYDKEIIVS
jgi:hypothetical protein